MRSSSRVVAARPPDASRPRCVLDRAIAVSEEHVAVGLRLVHGIAALAAAGAVLLIAALRRSAGREEST